MSDNYCDVSGKCSVAYDQVVQEDCTGRQHQSFDKFVKCPYLAENGVCNSQKARKEATERLTNPERHDE